MARPKIRLDSLLAARGLVASRAKARDLIGRGKVRVDGKRVTKPALAIDAETLIEVDDDVRHFVSRGAEKLIAGLDRFAIDPAGAIALDVGASTGGFTQVLLQRGAARVYAVDVGHGQLHAVLRADHRVVALEGTDARELDRTQVPEPVGLIVADVSFISLTLVLPAAMALATPGARLVALVKPQFEAGRGAIGKGGIVRDDDAVARALARVVAFLASRPGWNVDGTMASPIAGGDGNREHLIAARHEA